MKLSVAQPPVEAGGTADMLREEEETQCHTVAGRGGGNSRYDMLRKEGETQCRTATGRGRERREVFANFVHNHT